MHPSIPLLIDGAFALGGLLFCGSRLHLEFVRCAYGLAMPRVAITRFLNELSKDQRDVAERTPQDSVPANRHAAEAQALSEFDATGI